MNLGFVEEKAQPSSKAGAKNVKGKAANRTSSATRQ